MSACVRISLVSAKCCTVYFEISFCTSSSSQSMLRCWGFKLVVLCTPVCCTMYSILCKQIVLTCCTVYSAISLVQLVVAVCYPYPFRTVSSSIILQMAISCFWIQVVVATCYTLNSTISSLLLWVELVVATFCSLYLTKTSGSAGNTNMLQCILSCLGYYLVVAKSLYSAMALATACSSNILHCVFGYDLGTTGSNMLHCLRS